MNEKDILEFEKSLKVKKYTLKEFNFASGENLKNLLVEYVTIGKPIKNENGGIINAVAFFHGSGGNCMSIKRFHKIVSDEKVLGKYFIISITTLGSPNSFCPSNSGLGIKFPSYTIEDMVNF
ncbi:MAG: hypothetical protein LBV42_02250 [Methanobrevibacter sp.]|jgi:homoserine O-acetyltransferase|nr:hypothetical protein [Methanobrevibacter sp.]